MAFTYVASASGSNTGTIVDCSSTLHLERGDILVCTVAWGVGASTVAVATTAPADSFDMLATAEYSGRDYQAIGWVIVGTDNPAATIRATLGTSREAWINVMQFRPGVGEDISLEAGPSAASAGSGSSAQSGNISPEGDSLLLIGAAHNASGVTFASEQIGDIAADGYIRVYRSGLWYRIVTSSQTEIHAQATFGDNDSWVCDTIALLATSAGFSYTGSGQITFSGTALTRIEPYVGSGTFGLAGSATAEWGRSNFYNARETWPSFNRPVNDSSSFPNRTSAFLRKTPMDALQGGSTVSVILQYGFFGLQSASTNSYSCTGSGSVAFGGSATCSSGINSYSYNGNGSIAFGGSANVIKGYLCTGAGGITFDGSANVIKGFIYTGTGSIAFSGNAVLLEILSYVGNGSLTFGGSGTAMETISYLGSGGIVLSGSGDTLETLSSIGSGLIAFDGSAICRAGNDSYSYNGSGSISFSGSAVASRNYIYNGSGSIAFGGNSNTFVSLSYTGSGGIEFAGQATNSISISYDGNGSIDFAGDATCSYSADSLIYVINLYNGAKLAAHITPSTSDLRIKVGASYLGIPLTAATNDHAGSIRIKVGSTVYALKQS